MQFYELTITLLLLKDMHFTETNEKLAGLINGAMHLDSELAAKHKQKGYKFYVFNNLYPIEEDKIYKAGRVYVFKIRSLEQKFINRMKNLLPLVKSEHLKALASETKIFTKRHISELYTVTPALATVDNRHWVIGNDFVQLQERIQMNLEKKYNTFFKEKIIPEQSFIQRIEIINEKPICLKYKSTSLMTNKFKLYINEDAISQKLAFVALATGLLEKNASAGLGFCSAK